MKSVPRILLCTTGLLFVCFLFLFSMPVDREDVRFDLPRMSRPPPNKDELFNTDFVYVLGWSSNKTRNTSLYISVNESTANIMPEHFCDQTAFLLIMVCSAPANFHQRNAIRKTWGNERSILGHNITIYFLIGETANSSIQTGLVTESDQFGDLIQEHFIDSYNNLTLKSIQMVKLASMYCMNTTNFLLKTDDDMYVNVHHLVAILVDRNQSKELLLGKLICGARPVKDSTSKWYTPRYMFKDKIYPNYISGTGYVMSLDVVQRLFEVSLTTPIMHLEDVYLTGICARRAGIRPRGNGYFSYLKHHEICEMRYFVTMHHFTPATLIDAHSSLQNTSLMRACDKLKPTSNAHTWLLHNVLKPNKVHRKNKCL